MSSACLENRCSVCPVGYVYDAMGAFQAERVADAIEEVSSRQPSLNREDDPGMQTAIRESMGLPRGHTREVEMASIGIAMVLQGRCDSRQRLEPPH
jgi:hypothetical protein